MNNKRADQVTAFFDRTGTYLQHRYGIRLRAEIIRELLGDTVAGRTILDLGCGDGSLSLQFIEEGGLLTLVDLSGEMLAEAAASIPPGRAARVALVRSDLMAFNPPKPFDILLCVGVLAHVESVENAMYRIAALLKPGGRAVVQYTDQSRLLARLKFRIYLSSERAQPHYGYTVNRIWKAGFDSLAAEAGFSVLAERRYSLLLPGFGRLPGSWLYRYQRFTLNVPLVSRFGTDVIVLLKKN